MAAPPSLAAAASRRCCASSSTLIAVPGRRYPRHYDPSTRLSALHAAAAAFTSTAGAIPVAHDATRQQQQVISRPSSSSSSLMGTLLSRSGRFPPALAEAGRTSVAVSTFSTSATSAPPPPRALTLRRLSAPFLLLCHPDKASSSSASSELTTTTRDVNLRATQTLNGLIDTVEALVERSSASGAGGSSSSGRVGRGRIELRGRYEVEFLIPSSSSSASDFKKDKNKRNAETTYTRRSVVLSFPRNLRNAVQSIDSDGRYCSRSAGEVKRHAANEIVRLLNVAGVGVPDGAGRLLAKPVHVDVDGGDDDDEASSASDAYGHVLMDELDLDGASTDPYLNRTRFSSSSTSQQQQQRSSSARRSSKWDQSRRKFVNRINWAEHKRMTEEAYQDALADLATMNKMRDSEERRGRLIDGVLARVRFDPEYDANIVGEGEQTSKEEGSKDDYRDLDFDDDAAAKIRSKPSSNDGMDDYEKKGLDVMHQLIALRRMSLLLTDNYDYLEMERMGRLWEGTSIVLTPARGHHDDDDDDGTRVITSSAAYGIPRWKALGRGDGRGGSGRESGFKFTYGPKGNVTVHVPVDFEDDELLREMRANLWDYANLCGDGIDDLYPSYIRDAM